MCPTKTTIAHIKHNNADGSPAHPELQQPKDSAVFPSRDRHIDALKGFLIVLVVLGHIPYASFFSDKTSWQYIWVDSAISGLHMNFFRMPLFLAVGVLFIPALSKRFVKKIAIALLIPYVIWILQPTIIYDPARDLINAIGRFKDLLKGNYQALVSILWFLPALFSCKVIFSFAKLANNKIATWSKSKKYALYGVLGALWCVYFALTRKIAVLHCLGKIPFGIDIALYLIPMFIAIIAVYRHRAYLLKLHVIIILLIAAGATQLIVYVEPIKTLTSFHERIDLAQYSVPYNFFGYVGMVVLSGAILMLAYKLKSGAVLKLLSYVGTYSFPIYILHFKILKDIFLRFDGAASSLSPSVAVLALFGTQLTAIVLPIIFSKILMYLSTDFRYAGFVK
ncbi:hypothetical protein DJ568_16410 [Mucilaginibacter hurinus]|uniref:Acyltransferase 3 domain-containing protein n=1 Tax=Mucilaginibacter hurinus TaxID=2201324 RepID=A0A367GK31_9SPHI|nr:acyltransferase family protein [Mucilaginibacter hurinus]RCH53819.1 hypothetical protein DJ568_16410 [Mucilaginibacter hurinus]